VEGLVVEGRGMRPGSRVFAARWRGRNCRGAREKSKVSKCWSLSKTFDGMDDDDDADRSKILLEVSFLPSIRI